MESTNHNMIMVKYKHNNKRMILLRIIESRVKLPDNK